MNGKDIFLGLQYIGADLIENAEYGHFTKSNADEPPRRKIRPLVLLAAVIALLLVGCAVVYALRLQDMSIGQETYTQNFDDTGKAIDPVEKTRDILTYYGHNGDPIQMASKEWFEFLQTYDPDFRLADNVPDHPEIPDNLEFNYGCYTAEMGQKLTDIAAKYNLKLTEEWIPFQQYQSDIFFEETGIGSFLLPGSGASIRNMAGMLYPPYNFRMEFSLTTDSVTGLSTWMRFAHKDYFPPNSAGGMDLSEVEQWDYTAKDGTPLLLVLGKRGNANIIAQREDAVIVLSLMGNYSGSSYPTAEEVLTKEQLQQAADVFDYSILAKPVDRAAVEKRLQETEAAHQAEFDFTEPVYDSFSDYLTREFLRPDESARYTFCDLNRDGKDDLLIGSNGAIDQWITGQDGEMRTKWLISTYLCEDGVLESYDQYENWENHIYLKSANSAVMDDLDTDFVQIANVQRIGNQWYDRTITAASPQDGEISEAEAKAVIAEHPRVELDWKPLMDYPLAGGITLREHLNAKDVRVSSAELRRIYRDYLADREAKGVMYYSHYRILDINGDGVDDLLLKGEDDSIIGKTDYYWIALTYRYGRVLDLCGSFYLCENGVLEYTDTRHGGVGVEIVGHEFFKLRELEEKICDFVAYNKASASWQGDWHGDIPMTDSEANAILAKYPRMNQGMLPIRDLLG